MRHAGTQELATDRLLLRRLLPQDAQMMYENWASDPEVTRFLRWAPHKSPLETLELLAAWAELYQNPDYYQWAMVEKATGQVFGSISIFDAALGAPERKAEWPGQDTAGGVWEAGYCLGKRWWGMGFATEALKAVTDYWFCNTGSNWLTCCYAKENVASARVMQKAGFVYHHDGIDHKFDGTPVECHYYVMTRKASPLGIDFPRPGENGVAKRGNGCHRR